MSWVDGTYERAMNLYKSAISGHLQKARTPEMQMKESFLIAEFLKRDFTKRHQNIIIFIYIFSYAYGKEYALIPKLQDFELCGISKTKISCELHKLVDMKIIIWEKEANLFSIRDPREWKAPYHPGYNDPRSQDLFFLNLRHAGVNVQPILDKMNGD